MRHFIDRIKNLIRWIPVIWNNYDFDYAYIYEILKFKLKNLHEHLIECGDYEGAERDIEWVMTCIRLIDRVQNEYYIEEFMEKGPHSYTEMKAYRNQHDKAKKLLFKILEEKIENWWT